MRSLVDNPDIYFQLRESNNTAYAELPEIVEGYMAQISKLTGREYHLFNYYGAPDAERVIVAMGSVGGCAQEVVNYLNAKGEKVGFLFGELTAVGVEYVKAAVADAQDGLGSKEVTDLWRQHYGDKGYNL